MLLLFLRCESNKCTTNINFVCVSVWPLMVMTTPTITETPNEVDRPGKLAINNKATWLAGKGKRPGCLHLAVCLYLRQL